MHIPPKPFRASEMKISTDSAAVEKQEHLLVGTTIPPSSPPITPKILVPIQVKFWQGLSQRPASSERFLPNELILATHTSS